MSIADLAVWLTRGRRPEAVAIGGLAVSLAGIVVGLVSFVYAASSEGVRIGVFVFTVLFSFAAGVSVLTFSDALALIRNLRRLTDAEGEGAWLLHDDATPPGAAAVLLDGGVEPE